MGHMWYCLLFFSLSLFGLGVSSPFIFFPLRPIDSHKNPNIRIELNGRWKELGGRGRQGGGGLVWVWSWVGCIERSEGPARVEHFICDVDRNDWMWRQVTAIHVTNIRWEFRIIPDFFFFFHHRKYVCLCVLRWMKLFEQRWKRKNYATFKQFEIIYGFCSEFHWMNFADRGWMWPGWCHAAVSLHSFIIQLLRNWFLAVVKLMNRIGIRLSAEYVHALRVLAHAE